MPERERNPSWKGCGDAGLQARTAAKPDMKMERFGASTEPYLYSTCADPRQFESSRDSKAQKIMTKVIRGVSDEWGGCRRLARAISPRRIEDGRAQRIREGVHSHASWCLEQSVGHLR